MAKYLVFVCLILLSCSEKKSKEDFSIASKDSLIEGSTNNGLEIQSEINNLTEFLGNENLRKDVYLSTNETKGSVVNSYRNVRVIHIPTGIQTIGDRSDIMEVNLLIALRELKVQVDSIQKIK